MAAQSGERIWPGYGTAPFGMLLIADGRETLLCQPHPPESFKLIGPDPATGCERYERARSSLPDRLLAAMPVFGLPSTIVMGTPEATGLDRTAWVRTILHEHFHQWQTSRPGYFARVDALDLKGNDTSGMWMLNFAFPYQDPVVGQAYRKASLALADALAARGRPDFLGKFDGYLEARHAFAASAGERNWRYMEFELWQEGGARWTEYAIAKRDPDHIARDAALAGETKLLSRLRQPDLTSQGRELVYVYGTAELMLIDSCGLAWRDAYPTSTRLEPILLAARKECGLPRRLRAD
ncbi:hypothetical protein L2Y94_14950 [Luteibacter aegosomatis]|uniref:hypothetical protein n=1 Tax=Luteibacter aegosomatis TaxID=2911537 RepID=UPI001FF938F4|nr:hypothetical protein [Luteibacter aegosomatis]UPG84618.1 hypothetical protein L2Y94_14950 [Luteibacter aegosomatis]